MVRVGGGGGGETVSKCRARLSFHFARHTCLRTISVSTMVPYIGADTPTRAHPACVHPCVSGCAGLRGLPLSVCSSEKHDAGGGWICQDIYGGDDQRGASSAARWFQDHGAAASSFHDRYERYSYDRRSNAVNGAASWQDYLSFRLAEACGDGEGGGNVGAVREVLHLASRAGGGTGGGGGGGADAEIEGGGCPLVDRAWGGLTPLQAAVSAGNVRSS